MKAWVTPIPSPVYLGSAEDVDDRPRASTGEIRCSGFFPRSRLTIQAITTVEEEKRIKNKTQDTIAQHQSSITTSHCVLQRKDEQRESQYTVYSIQSRLQQNNDQDYCPRCRRTLLQLIRLCQSALCACSYSLSSRTTPILPSPPHPTLSLLIRPTADFEYTIISH